MTLADSEVNVVLQLTYISTARKDVGGRDVDQILASSRRNNSVRNITGMLLFDGRRFLQALEGEDDQVAATYERIKSDARHRAIVTLSSKIVTERQFGAWAMAWHRVDPVAGGKTLAETVDALTANVPDANTRELFRGFARIDRQAA